MRPSIGRNKSTFVWWMDSFPITIKCTNIPTEMVTLVTQWQLRPAVNSPYADTRPQKFSWSRIRADVSKRFLLARRDIISLSSLVLRGMLDRGSSSTILVGCKRCIRRSITELCANYVCSALQMFVYAGCVGYVKKNCSNFWHYNLIIVFMTFFIF